MTQRSQYILTTPKKAKYSDFTMNLDAHPDTKQIFLFTDVNSVKRSLRNLIFTDKYERFFNPNLGCGIRSLLFDNMTPETLIRVKDVIKETIENYEPRVSIVEIEVLGHEDQNAVTINLVFEIINIPERQFLQIDVNRAR
jgi:phage baseplate assembly protein W